MATQLHTPCSYARAAAVAFRLAVVLAAPAAPRLAHASPVIPVRTVDAPRLTVADVVPTAPADLARIDLGPAPPAGSNRLVRRDEIIAALPEGQGLPPAQIPPTTRVVRTSTKLTPAALEGLVRGAAATKLPRGATLVAVRPRGQAVVPRAYDATELVVAKPPRKVGRHVSDATLRFTHEGVVVATVQVPIEMQIPASAIVPAIRKGAPMVVVVTRGAVEVQAQARANEDADLGETLQVTVEGSGKVLRVRLVEDAPPRGTVEP